MKELRAYDQASNPLRAQIDMLNAQLDRERLINRQLNNHMNVVKLELRMYQRSRDWLLNNGYDDLFEAAAVAIRLEEADETAK